MHEALRPLKKNPTDKVPTDEELRMLNSRKYLFLAREATEFRRTPRHPDVAKVLTSGQSSLCTSSLCGASPTAPIRPPCPERENPVKKNPTDKVPTDEITTDEKMCRESRTQDLFSERVSVSGVSAMRRFP